MRFFSLFRGSLLAVGLLSGAAALGQPRLTSSSPARNQPATARTAALALTFDQAVSAATGGNIRLFSSQRGGQLVRAGQGTVSGGGTSTIGFDPATDFRPGETLFLTVPPTVQGPGGAPASPYVYQFTAATGGLGRGEFVAVAGAADLALPARPGGLVLGDVDGDGDLDLLTANTSGTVSVRLGNGAARFTASATAPDLPIAPNGYVFDLALGDVDADGDFDLLVTTQGAGPRDSLGAVVVRLSDGTGRFRPLVTPRADPAVGAEPWRVALGDLDGDGDLDLLTTGFSGLTGGSVSVRFNRDQPTGLGTEIGSTADQPGPRLTLYPNPADRANQAVCVAGLAVGELLELLDLTGRPVRTGRATPPLHLLDVRGLPAGVYVVRGSGRVQRLVVQ